VSEQTFEHSSVLPFSAADVFAYHARPGAFRRLVPSWEPVRFGGEPTPLVEGHVERVRVRIGPFWHRWEARISEVRPGRGFSDVQVSGPFRSWRHVHDIEPLGPDSCRLTDRIHFAIPGGALGALVAKGSIQNRLRRMFRYRHDVTARDLAAQQTRSGPSPMKIAITGSSGLLGSHLEPFLTAGGHSVTRLVRRIPLEPSEARWNPGGHVDPDSRLEGHDAVIHLAGEGIATRRWSARQKALIYDSRVLGTQHLVSTLAKLQRPPRVLLCASAVGIYGDRGDERLTESSSLGDDYLAGVCKGWEEVSQRFTDEGARVVNLRFGAILSPRGGALARMLPAFRLGLAGRLGSGNQWMSWISLLDAVHAIHHVLHDDSITGPVNMVAPTPVTNRAFTRVLGEVLNRPTVFPMPATAARLAFGELADALLLASQRAEPDVLLASGYEFSHGGMEDALRHLLGRTLDMRPVSH
jgi:uncharacterized protein